ncbi:uncharacterized protein CCOS01_00298 [Colletotrichum costaricense]|uniref:Uncharacterized protein n=2 Tax=Colletotrichum acutatum species complex TaxID=2707335 RepID=A0AAJ0E7S0_9PEZI|nr:uncharacterized protein CCOS01_00298 [Colletotrichum costaricense]XP_060378990.1 uncharacterized protein CTAM01_10379 [Colletotrichum tamarilloi]KAK1491264.1 hypothetical protein CTAM01_10379 [Colletotrichum tamarilloi]KAK1538984.1 hypothetical protein CCOS01_00298 [Colletotrichum costaricense]
MPVVQQQQQQQQPALCFLGVFFTGPCSEEGGSFGCWHRQANTKVDSRTVYKVSRDEHEQGRPKDKDISDHNTNHFCAMIVDYGDSETVRLMMDDRDEEVSHKEVRRDSERSTKRRRAIEGRLQQKNILAGAGGVCRVIGD